MVAYVAPAGGRVTPLDGPPGSDLDGLGPSGAASGKYAGPGKPLA